MADKFGGIPVDEAKTDKFGGVAVEEPSTGGRGGGEKGQGKEAKAGSFFSSHPDATRFALGALPAIGATGLAIFQPELIPAAGFLSEMGAGGALAAVGGAGGSLVEQGIESATGMPERPRSALELGRRALTEGAEQGGMEMGGRLIAKPFGFVLKKLAPESLYGRAIKPSTTLPVADRNRVIQTGLREGIPASEGGYDKLLESIKDVTGQIDQKLAAKSKDLGAVIDPQTVAKRLDALQEHFAVQGYPDADVATIKKVRDSFLSRHSYQAPYTKIAPGEAEEAGRFVPVGKGSTQVFEPMTLADAQAEKRGTYRYNEWRNNATPQAQEQAEKALARGLKDQIAELFPEIKSLNARDSDMLALEEQMRRFVGREANKNVVGLIPAALGAGAEAAGGAPAALLTLGVMALDNKDIQSRLAIALAKASKSRASGLTMRLGKEVVPATARGLKDLMDQGQ